MTKPSRSVRRALLALCLAALLALSGCAKQEAVITLIEPDASTQETIDYNAPGYYAPEAGVVSPGEIMPAPASVPGAASTEQPQVDSASGSLDKGDMTIGIVVGQEADIHPLRAIYRDLYSVNALVFEGLVELDENMKPVPLLADRWTVSGKDWTFTLRSGIQFHNGLPLTAQDVVDSYQAALANRASYWYDLVSQIEAMEAVDELTVRVRSKGMGQMLLYCMTFPVLQSGTIDTQLPMGTGPYWYTNHEQDIAIRLERNPFWWKRPTDTIQSVVVLCYKTIAAALSGLETGEVDTLATEYPTASLSRNLSDRQTFDYTTLTYECLIPNLRNGILSDISVRQAVLYAIDRTTLGDNIYAGLVQESEVPVIPGSWLYNAQATRFHYSPERALQLLYDAGWTDADQNGILEKEFSGKTRNLTLTLLTYDRGTTATRSEAASAIAKQLALVGFDVQIEVTDAAGAQKALSDGKFDLVLGAFELSTAPNLAFLLASTGKSNYSSYASHEMDSALQEAYSAADDDSLQTAMAKVQQQMADDLPILGLFFRTGILITRQSLGGLKGVYQYDTLRGLATVTPVK